MKIKGKFSADVVKFVPKYEPSTKFRSVLISIVKKVDEKQAKKIFGDKLHEIAFGGMKVIGGGEGDTESKRAEFPYLSMKPSLVCEVHELRIEDKSGLVVQPKIAKIEPAGKDDPKVAVTIEFSINIAKNKGLAGALMTMSFETLEFEFEATQKSLPFPTTTRGKFGNPTPVMTNSAPDDTAQAAAH